jgi:hypothetical protein
MKKLIALSLFYFTMSTSFSQSPLLNYTEEQLRNECHDSYFTTNYTKDGQRYLETQSDYLKTSYYFNKDGLTYLCIIKPLTQSELNYMIQSYNNIAVVINDTKWKLYTHNSIINITLWHITDYFFTYDTLKN